jgi:hypothetical protein
MVYWLEQVSINNYAHDYVYILIHTISFEHQPSMKVNIHNQCSDFKLTGRNGFKNCTDWNKEPDVEVDAGSTTNAILTSYWAEFKGAIMYKLQRKSVKSNDQLRSTSILLCIAWRSEGYKKLRVFVHLIECDKTFYWNECKLREYYQRYASQLNTYIGPIKDTWLLDGDTVLTTRLELDFTQRDGVLNIAISEGIKGEYTKRPIWINPER